MHFFIDAAIGRVIRALLILKIRINQMLNAIDRIIPVLCFAVILWPFAIMPFAFVVALFTTLTGIAIMPALTACAAIPLSIYWAGKVWQA
jgi:hypothetical protein